MVEERRGKRIEIDDLQEGMKLAQDIDNRYGGVLLPAGTILTDRKIARLQDLNYQQVKIVGESQKKINKNIEKFSRLEDLYREEVQKTASLYKKVKFKGEIDEDILHSLIDDVMNFSAEIEISDLLNMVRGVDEYTYTHLLNVGILSNIMGKWLDFNQEWLEKLTLSGLLHDVGKTKISDEILNKPYTLNVEEYEIMKKHSQYGYEIVDESDFITKDTALGILTHHEYYNGQGYPLQLEGEDIPLFGRIIAIVDAFDAITAERIYQRKSSPFAALEKIQRENFGYCDPRLKKIFLDKIPNFFIREKVKLSNGEIGEIVFINNRNPSAPIIKLENDYIDLSTKNSLEIEEILKQ